MIKTGEQHIASLRDGREIYLDGELVDDVTTHPAFRGAVASIGRMFDFQSAASSRSPSLIASIKYFMFRLLELSTNCREFGSVSTHTEIARDS